MPTKLENFSAHRKALVWFDFVVADLRPLTKHPALARLVAQQIASADSIAANIEEGYGRGSARNSPTFSSSPGARRRRSEDASSASTIGSPPK
jgi:hypothetical protein